MPPSSTTSLTEKTKFQVFLLHQLLGVVAGIVVGVGGIAGYTAFAVFFSFVNFLGRFLTETVLRVDYGRLSGDGQSVGEVLTQYGLPAMASFLLTWISWYNAFGNVVA